MKKVLFVTYYWPPSGKASLYWPFDMIKYLPESNWHPAVITAEQDTFNQRDESFLDELDPNLVVFSTKSPEPFNVYKRFLGKDKSESLVASEAITETKNGIRHRLAVWIRMNLFIPDARVGWYLPSVVQGRKFLTGNFFDAIISVGPPHTSHLIAKRLGKMFGIPHIPVFIDPWTDIVYYKNYKRNYLAQKLDNYFEKSVLTNANKVVFVTETMKNDYLKKYNWLENKSHVLYWGYNEESFINLPLSNDAANLQSNQEVLLHAGNIFDYQNPIHLWKHIKKLNDTGRKIKIKFVGTVSPAVTQSIQETGLSKYTEYAGFLSYPEMILELHKADYLMVCASEPRHVPGKLFEYMRSGKPILAFGDGNEEVRSILTKANAGMLFSYSEDGHEFFENISNFKTDISFVKKFDRKNIARELAEILNKK